MRRVLLAISLVLVPLGARADTEAMGLALDALAQGDMGL